MNSEFYQVQLNFMNFLEHNKEFYILNFCSSTNWLCEESSILILVSLVHILVLNILICV